jgi:hypothetical protein
MQVYFSHSYRDVTVNAHFLDHFIDEEISLSADQKTDIWCVAKLERYLSEMNGFVSVIPPRPTEQDSSAYSLYIGQELNLARRARVPRLLFVDEQILKRHRLDFPEDVVSYKYNRLDEDIFKHRDAIRNFREALETTYRMPRAARTQYATLISGDTRALRRAAQDLAEILRREDYAVTLLFGNRPGRGLDDIRLLETLWRSELCVFLLGERLSDTHIALAMAHAYCIPSLRLQYDKTAPDCNPSLSGIIRWHSLEDMLVEFSRQLTSYKMGLVQPVEIARSSSATDAARSMGTMRWSVRKDNLWDTNDGLALAQHVFPIHTFVQDEVNRVRAQLKRSLARERGREASMQICRLLYDGIQRHRLGYEVEPQTGEPGIQAIRTPLQIETHRTATCIDLACLFASMLEAAVQNPIIVVLEGQHFAHALVGYRALDEPNWSSPNLGDLRRAVELGDAVLVEATGMIEADSPVGEETQQERRDKLLDFMDAKDAAKRMLFKSEIHLRHLVDIRSLRQSCV